MEYNFLSVNFNVNRHPSYPVHIRIVISISETFLDIEFTMRQLTPFSNVVNVKMENEGTLFLSTFKV